MGTPKGWTASKFGDVLIESEERRGTRSEVPVLSVTKSRGPMLASERFGKAMHGRNLAAYRLARRGTIVADPMLLWDGTIGLQDVVDIGAVSPDYRVYDVRAGTDVRYMAYVVREPGMRRHYQGGARGTNVRRNRIARSDFLAIPLQLPPLPEQRKIAAILSSVDETIEQTEAVIDQLRVVKKAMMAELLTRGMPGRHTRFKRTEIGEIPEGWEVVRLEQVAVVQTGIAKGKAAVEGATAVPYLRVANLQDQFLDLREVKTIDVSEDQVERYRLRVGDVLFCEGGDADKVGRGSVWRGEVDVCLHQNHVFAVRPRRDVLSSDFLSIFRSSARGRRYFLDCAKQTTNLASINSSQLKSLLLPLPMLTEQEAIVQVLAGVSAVERAETETLSRMRSTKAALASSLLSGDLRVTPDEAPR